MRDASDLRERRVPRLGPRDAAVHPLQRAAARARTTAPCPGYPHQRILFDDLWAGANPVLATSMLRWFGDWDPLGA